jgi:hypothetical protein
LAISGLLLLLFLSANSSRRIFCVIDAASRLVLATSVVFVSRNIDVVSGVLVREADFCQSIAVAAAVGVTDMASLTGRRGSHNVVFACPVWSNADACSEDEFDW